MFGAFLLFYSYKLLCYNKTKYTLGGDILNKIKLGILTLTISLALALQVNVKASGIDDGTNLGGLGTVSDAWSRSIYPSNTWSRITSKNSSGNQITHLLDFNINDQELKPVVTYGDYIYGLDTLGSLVRAYEDKGYKVAFAINGDSFFADGTPKGTMIKDGIIESTGGSYLTSLGFDHNNRIIYGNPQIHTSAWIGGKRIPISQINTERGTKYAPAYLLTDSFASTTKSTTRGVEAVINVTSPGYKGLRVNTSAVGTVEKLYHVDNNSNGNTTPIKPGQIVLTAHNASLWYRDISSLRPGETVTISTVSKDKENNWENVRNAIGVFRPLKEKGSLTPRASETDVHPRTTVAFRKDGFFRIMENDGRMESARGLSYRDCVNFLNIAGFENVLAFDGGGSSTFYVNLPGMPQAQILNKPSDGSERRIANALLFIKERQDGQTCEVLHLYPRSQHRTEVTMNAGTSIGVDVKGTDAKYNPATIDTSQVTYDSEYGSGRGNTFYAGPNAGDGYIIGKYPNGASGSLRLRVINNIKSLSYPGEKIEIAPGASQQIQIQANIPKSSYILENKYLEYELTDPELGEINSDGLFISSGKHGQANIIAKFGDHTREIPIIIKSEKEIKRLSGDNRFATAASIASKFEISSSAILASSSNFPDALVASVLAKQIQAPILLTDGTSIGQETLASLERLGVENIYILGGTNSISGPVGDSLRDMGYKVERIHGSSRYQTAVKIAEKIPSNGQAYLASGENYPDALSLTSLAARENSPILLVGKNILANETLAYLRANNISKIIIAGGPGAISQELEDTLASKGINVERIWGENRYETSAKIAKLAYPPENGFIIANGNHYVDALTAGPLTSYWSRSIVLVQPDQLPDQIEGLLKNAKAENVTIIGGKNSVSDLVKARIENLVK